MATVRKISYSFITGAIGLLVIFGQGCLNPFAPAVLGPSTVKAIVEQVTPDNVLHNFKYAYEHNDIDVYENCLDKNFIFRYSDQDRTGTIVDVEVPRDGSSGDLERTRNLFSYFDEIKLDPWIPVFNRTEIVGEEVWQVYDVFFQLSVRDTDGNFGYEQFEATGIAEFKFRQSDDDDLWRIVFWDDQSNQ